MPRGTGYDVPVNLNKIYHYEDTVDSFNILTHIDYFRSNDLIIPTRSLIRVDTLKTYFDLFHGDFSTLDLPAESKDTHSNYFAIISDLFVELLSAFPPIIVPAGTNIDFDDPELDLNQHAGYLDTLGIDEGDLLREIRKVVANIEIFGTALLFVDKTAMRIYSVDPYMLFPADEKGEFSNYVTTTSIPDVDDSTSRFLHTIYRYDGMLSVEQYLSEDKTLKGELVATPASVDYEINPFIPVAIDPDGVWGRSAFRDVRALARRAIITNSVLGHVIERYMHPYEIEKYSPERSRPALPDPGAAREDTTISTQRTGPYNNIVRTGSEMPDFQVVYPDYKFTESGEEYMNGLERRLYIQAGIAPALLGHVRENTAPSGVSLLRQLINTYDRVDTMQKTIIPPIVEAIKLLTGAEVGVEWRNPIEELIKRDQYQRDRGLQGTTNPTMKEEGNG